MNHLSHIPAIESSSSHSGPRWHNIWHEEQQVGKAATQQQQHFWAISIMGMPIIHSSIWNLESEASAILDGGGTNSIPASMRHNFDASQSQMHDLAKRSHCWSHCLNCSWNPSQTVSEDTQCSIAPDIPMQCRTSFSLQCWINQAKLIARLYDSEKGHPFARAWKLRFLLDSL